MSINIIFALSMLYLSLPAAHSRKSFLVKEQHPALFAPKVLAYDTTWKVFNISNYMLILDNSIQVSAGFDFIQNVGFNIVAPTVRQTSFRNNFYITTDFVLHPNLLLNGLYKGEVFVEVPKVRTNFFFWELLYFPDTQYTAAIVPPATVGVVTNYPTLCLQFGYNSDPITLLMNADFNLISCYKNLIKTVTDWSQWSFTTMLKKGFFDSCTQSTSSTNQLYKWMMYPSSAMIVATPSLAKSSIAYDNLWFGPIIFSIAGANP